MKKFEYKREIRQNPFSGIMSFQHYNGEKLYSDCISGRIGTAGVETENYECYPIPMGVEENGRSEGWYPENTIAYMRVLWKDFEPKQGEFNYGLIEKILDGAREHRQVLAFRLMPHSTCERDDVPDWLKGIMDCPERPDGKRVKASPKDPRYLTIFADAIRAFGERFDKDPTLYSMDISLAGAWGEGEGTENYPADTVIALQDTYIKYFPNTYLIGQMSNAKLLDYISKYRPVGWRGDGCGEPNHMNIYYPKWVGEQPENLWKTAPVSFESYWWLGEWYRQGWDIDKIIEQTLSWHISSFNPKSFPIPEEFKPKVEYWLSKMGYHFKINYFDFKQDKNNATITIEIENVGVAPIYAKLPLKIKFKNNKTEQIFDTGIDIRHWIDKTTETIALDIASLKPDTYTAEIGITDNQTTAYFATTAEFDNNYYIMDTVEIK